VLFRSAEQFLYGGHFLEKSSYPIEYLAHQKIIGSLIIPPTKIYRGTDRFLIDRPINPSNSRYDNNMSPKPALHKGLQRYLAKILFWRIATTFG
jgi:hypothetical protein